MSLRLTALTRCGGEGTSAVQSVFTKATENLLSLWTFRTCALPSNCSATLKIAYSSILSRTVSPPWICSIPNFRSFCSRGFSSSWQSKTSSIQQLGFKPTRFYPKRLFATSESYVFGSLMLLGFAVASCAHEDLWGVRKLVLEHGRASVDALYSGTYYPLVTSTFCHSNMIHCAINAAWLYAYRHFQPLGASQLLGLFTAGGIAGTCAHVAYYWYNAGGLEFGPEYSCSTPGYMGSSAAVASVLAYKVVQKPLGSHRVLFVPLPVAATLALFLVLELKQEEYLDGSAAKAGGAAFGVLIAIAGKLLRK